MNVTVLLPFHNAADTLNEAIASMVGQTFRDHEIVLIDNASEDASRAIADGWSARDERITVLEAPSIGIAYALNIGLEHAKGTYIARMDADDISHTDRIAHQVAFMQAHPEIGVVGTRTRFETTVAKSSGMRWFVDWQNAILTPHDHYVKRFVDAPLAHPSVLFRRDLAERFGGYDTGPLPEDHELWLRWMHNGVRIAKLPEELLTWNDHPMRLSRTHPNYGVDAFFTTKAKWIAAWYARKYHDDRPVIIAGTSNLCRERARKLEHLGMRVEAFTDVRERMAPGYRFIPHNELPGKGEALVISFISQRGTGDRIAEYLASRGLVEGEDFILAA